MSLRRCLVHDVFWDSDKVENCILCTWVTHVDPTQSPNDHQGDDHLTCVCEPEQS